MSKEIGKWERIASEQMADCKVFKVRVDRSVNGVTKREHKFYCIEAPDWVNVIPITANGQVLLIEQFRHGIEELTLEIPGGMVDTGEKPLEAAVRELVEETGYTPRGEVIPLGRTRPNPAIQNNWMHHFLALDVAQTQDTAFDATEDVRTRLVSLSDISGLIKNGAITHALVVVAFHRLHLLETHRTLL